MSEVRNYFKELFAVNVSDKVEKKNGLSYVSWSYAWGELKKQFPKSFYTVYENEQGWPYFTDGKTCWVKTGVTVVEESTQKNAFTDAEYNIVTDSIEHIEYLPIMDFKNKSIPVDQVTSMDVNKAIQRSLTKAIARHGLGLYIYSGEDLPEQSEETKKLEADLKKKITKKEATVLGSTLSEAQKAWVVDTYHVNTLEELTVEQYGKLMRTLNERKSDGD